MSNAACILVFGRDPILLETRRLVLQSTDGVVHATTNLAEAERILDRFNPDLIVLCYTLSTQENAVIVKAAQRLGNGVRILTLTADGMPERSEGEHNIFTGARAFKARVMELLSERGSQERPAGQKSF